MSGSPGFPGGPGETGPQGFPGGQGATGQPGFPGSVGATGRSKNIDHTQTNIAVEISFKRLQVEHPILRIFLWYMSFHY